MTTGFLKFVPARKARTSGAKARILLVLNGTAEAVPLPKNQNNPELFSSLRRGKPRLYTSFSAG